MNVLCQAEKTIPTSFLVKNKTQDTFLKSCFIVYINIKHSKLVNKANRKCLNKD